MRFPDLSPGYEHPADRGALAAPPALPFLHRARRCAWSSASAASAWSTSRDHPAPRLRQYPELHAIVAQVRDHADLHLVLELFVTMNPVPQAFTIGLTGP